MNGMISYGNYTHNCHMHHICTQNMNTQIDSIAVTKYFITEYYRNVSNFGWNSIQNLFDSKCIVMLKDKNVGNEYELLNLLSLESVKRANYGNLRIKCTIINSTNLLINAFGQIQFVSFSGQISNMIPFTETFVLTLIDTTNNTVSCTRHIFDF